MSFDERLSKNAVASHPVHTPAPATPTAKREREKMSMATHVALITGGAQGIGRGIAVKLLSAVVPAQQWSVAVVDKDPAGIEDFQDFIEKRGLPADRVLVMFGDVGRQITAQRVVTRVVQQFGKLDLLVNNAGGGGLGVPLESVTEELWHQVLDSNLSSAFFFSQAASPFLEKVRGSIVNVSSTRAIMSEPNSFPYSASKGGVESLTHSLAVSLAGKVNVNCVRLGWVDVTASEFGAGRQQIHLSADDHKQHLAGRVGRAEDVADAVLFLSNAPFVCGECITIDGGMTKKMIYTDEEEK